MRPSPPWLSLLVVPLLLAAGACATRPAIPAETPPAQRFAAWLQAFNAGDDAALDRHVEDAFRPDPKRRLRQHLAREAAARFEPVKVEESTPSRLVAQLRAKPSGELFGFAMEVETQPPHRVTRFSMSRLSSQLSDDESIQRGKAFVERLSAADQFSGVVLVARRAPA